MSAQECLRKTYVTLRYIPPKRPAEPANCKLVAFTKDPEIRIFTGQISALEGRQPDEIIGIRLHCVVPSTEGAGAIILLLQISTYIEWEVGFLSKTGDYVHEIHRLFVSIPMMYKLKGPRIALMAVSPWKLKLPAYAAQIAAAFYKLHEIENVMKQILPLKKGFCPEDIRAMVDGLKSLETQLNHLLQRAAQGSAEREIARKMEHRPDGAGRFAATRLA